MTTVWPLRFRPMADRVLLADEAGGWSVAAPEFLDRYGRDVLTDQDQKALLQRGHAFNVEDDLYHTSFVTKWARRHRLPSADINYLILVPTLRCNLECSYCQVSRAAETARGYDWDEATTEAILSFIGGLATPSIKIEFQGGEPLLRLDLLNRVRDFCRQRFTESSFVVCSNFQDVSAEAWSFFESNDTRLSTSVDGTIATHTRQRTGSIDMTSKLIENLREFRQRFGSQRLSALPTIDVRTAPDPKGVVETFADLGLNSIFLRPVNYQGFARRTAPAAGFADAWAAYHQRFVDAIIEWNFKSDDVFEEFYLSHVIRRILAPGFDNLVDLRNPNLLGRDYLVVDYDGTLYPTDEARMMARARLVDLSIGNVEAGVDLERLALMNASAFNDLDADCIHCPYQPYCGTDNIDAVSRYGRADVPRRDTWFCQRHLSLFDLAFRLLSSTDEKVVHSLKRWTGVETWPSHFSEVLH